MDRHRQPRSTLTGASQPRSFRRAPSGATVPVRSQSPRKAAIDANPVGQQRPAILRLRQGYAAPEMPHIADELVGFCRDAGSVDPSRFDRAGSGRAYRLPIEELDRTRTRNVGFSRRGKDDPLNPVACLPFSMLERPRGFPKSLIRLEEAGRGRFAAERGSPPVVPPAPPMRRMLSASPITHRPPLAAPGARRVSMRRLSRPETDS